MKPKAFALLVFSVVLGCALSGCGSSEAEDEAWRSRIIKDYVHGQVINYGWLEDEIKITDEKDFVLIVERLSERTSDVACQADASERANGSFAATIATTGQVEVDLLKYSLERDVLLCVYASDGYLLSINHGQNPFASGQEQTSTGGKIDELISSAAEFAEENRSAWLEGFRSNMLQESADNYTDIIYSVFDGDVEIDMVMLSSSSALFDVEERQMEFDRYWQCYAEAIASVLGTGVQIEFVSFDTGEVEKAFSASAGSPLYEPEHQSQAA